MIRQLADNQRGATAVLVAAALPFLLAAAAAAIDIGAVALERRRMQGAVDAAALSAVYDLSAAEARARTALTANRATTPKTLVAIGSIAGSGAARKFTPDPNGDAVQVSATYPNPTHFLGALGLRFKEGSVSATATRRNLAAISIGSGLISLNNGVVNSVTRTLTGSSIGLSVLSYQGLANANINLFSFLDAVAVQGNLGVLGYDQLLKQDIALPILLRALDQASGTSALGTVAAGINGTPRSLRLGDLIGLDLASAGSTGSGGAAALLATVRASDLLGAMLALANRDHIMTLDLGGGIPGIASLHAELKVGETIRSSPWMVINQNGGVEVSTAQARLNLVTEIGPLLGLGVKLPIALEVAPARAILDAVPCDPRQAAAVRARAGIARIAIADIGIGSPIPANAAALTPAPLIRAPLISVEATALAAAESSNWQNLTFTKAEIAAHQAKSITTTNGISTLLGTLMSSSDIDVRLLGLGLGIGLPGEHQVVGRLLSAIPALESAIVQLLAFAGLSIGTADVRVDGYRCGNPVLVA